MWTWRTLVTVLLLILPVLSDDLIKSTCEIPSVEVGDNTTLTIHFGDDLTQERIRDFFVVHQDRNSRETRVLTCRFSNGDVECDKTPCCTWESKVTDVFRVYIHNASQQLEGKFWGFVIPADTTYQKYCNFALKAHTCPTDSINATNSHVTCNNQSVTIGQSCNVTCYSGYYFQENQTSVTYTCVGKNKWSPEIPVKSCEAVTCHIDSITATNSRATCTNTPVTIGQTCTVKCNSGHYIEENQTSVTYKCAGNNIWSPEMSLISCEDQKTQTLYFLFPLLSAVLIVTVLVILFMRRHKEKTKRKNKEDPLLPLKSTDLKTWTCTQDTQTPLPRSSKAKETQTETDVKTTKETQTTKHCKNKKTKKTTLTTAHTQTEKNEASTKDTQTRTETKDKETKTEPTSRKDADSNTV